MYARGGNPQKSKMHTWATACLHKCGNPHRNWSKALIIWLGTVCGKGHLEISLTASGRPGTYQATATIL